MPMVYQDSEEATQIRGMGWSQPYAESMGEGESPRRRRRHRHGNPVKYIQAGERLTLNFTNRTPAVRGPRVAGLEKFYDAGMGRFYDAGMGDAPASEFPKWSHELDQYTDYIPFINDKNTRESLAHKANNLYPEQQRLIQEYKGTPGIATIAEAAVFNKKVNSFRDSVNKGRDEYGLSATPFPVYLLKKLGKPAAKAGSIPWLPILIGGGALVAAKFLKIF